MIKASLEEYIGVVSVSTWIGITVHNLFIPGLIP
jgi:hypothetical protein